MLSTRIKKYLEYKLQRVDKSFIKSMDNRNPDSFQPNKDPMFKVKLLSSSRLHLQTPFNFYPDPWTSTPWCKLWLGNVPHDKAGLRNHLQKHDMTSQSYGNKHENINPRDCQWNYQLKVQDLHPWILNIQSFNKVSKASITPTYYILPLHSWTLQQHLF